jgi:hypothetical protein
LTAYFTFTPSRTSIFRFRPTLDGQAYSATCTFNLAVQRWYINLFASNNVRVLSKPIIGSTDRIQTSLTTQAGSLVATVGAGPGIGTGTKIISTQLPSETVVGAIAGTSIGMVLPSGASQTAITSGTDTTALFSNDINIVASYFTASTLIYRASTGNFEISP